MPRPAVAIALPQSELVAVSAQLAEAGYEPIAVETADELEELLNRRHDIGVAILDGENDFDRTLEMYAMLHDEDRNIPALMVVAARALDRMSLAGRTRVTACERPGYCSTSIPPASTAPRCSAAPAGLDSARRPWRCRPRSAR